MNNKKRLLKLLRQHRKGLSKKQIYMALGYWNVGDLVMKLRNDGHKIKTKMVKGKNRYDESARYAVYHI